MDFIIKLLRTTKGFDAIWVNMDRLTKGAHFLAGRKSSSAVNLADVYARDIIARHGVLVYIVANRDVRFTCQF